MKKLFYFLTLVIVFMSSCGEPKIAVDQILIADKIYICNEQFDVTEAIAITDGKIVDFGTAKEIKSKYAGKIEEVDGTIYPGFIDAHSHFYGYSLTLHKVNLINVSSLDELIDRTIAFAKTSNEAWITGRGWDQTTWEEKGTLTNNLLNAYFPNTPVFLKRVDGHAGLANAKKH